MMKKMKSTDLLFAGALLIVFVAHVYLVFSPFILDDESFYAVVPFRLVNGDSLIQDEWHLTQFSSLFSYLPVYLWTTIKGSADGIFVFLRCIYLFIHTSIAVVIYAFFKKHGKVAILVSMMFFIQVPYKILAISYQSMFVVFLLLLTLCLISIYEKESVRSCIFAGVCYGFCCVCNPLFCFAFILYFIVFILWTNRQKIEDIIVRKKLSKSNENLTKKQREQQKQQIKDNFINLGRYSCFLKKETFSRVVFGILITAVIAIVFYFITGGTLRAIGDNIENLLNSSEYEVVSDSIFTKFYETLIYFTKANFGMPWILPALFIAMAIDKKRKDNAHRFRYLMVALIWSIIYIIAVAMNYDFYLCAATLPFSVISTICYLLTENRNKVLFRCVCIPCYVGVIFQYLAANTHLAVIGIVLVVSNLAGVFFVRDLWKEMQQEKKGNEDTGHNKAFSNMCRGIIIISFCVQIAFYGAVNLVAQTYTKDDVKITTGPFAGLYTTEEKYESYNKQISDMDVIRELARDDQPVLLASFNNWMYLYLDRPIATYHVWYRGTLKTELLIEYYEENPDKIPDYIYVGSLAHDSGAIRMARELFEFTETELSSGILLTVEYCKF